MLAGAVAGLSLYTYLASRIFPVVALGFLGIQLVVDRPRLRARARGLVLAALVFLVVAAPLLGYLATHREAILGRPTRVAVAVARSDADGFVSLDVAGLRHNLRQVVGMFFDTGDENWRQNF